MHPHSTVHHIAFLLMCVLSGHHSLPLERPLLPEDSEVPNSEADTPETETPPPCQRTLKLNFDECIRSFDVQFAEYESPETPEYQRRVMASELCRSYGNTLMCFHEALKDCSPSEEHLTYIASHLANKRSNMTEVCAMASQDARPSEQTINHMEPTTTPRQIEASQPDFSTITKLFPTASSPSFDEDSDSVESTTSPSPKLSVNKKHQIPLFTHSNVFKILSSLPRDSDEIQNGDSSHDASENNSIFVPDCRHMYGPAYEDCVQKSANSCSTLRLSHAYVLLFLTWLWTFLSNHS